MLRADMEEQERGLTLRDRWHLGRRGKHPHSTLLLLLQLHGFLKPLSLLIFYISFSSARLKTL